jgi:hypothetical protein
VSCLSTGEVVFLPVGAARAGPGPSPGPPGAAASPMAAAVAVVSGDYAGAVGVAAAEGMLFVLGSESVPALPHRHSAHTGAHRDAVLHAADTDTDTDTDTDHSDADDAAGEGEDEGEGEAAASRVGASCAVLSLQEMCERQLAERISVRTVGGLVATARCLLRSELLGFCMDFVSR